MKKIIILLFIITLLIGCKKTESFVPITREIPETLKITEQVGIKLASSFVTTEVSMNVKSEISQTATIKIFDISNKVVSKETVDIKAGDNILTVYTNSLPSSAYRIGLFDFNGKQLGITDFNKLQ
jgi:hypothetical protein